MHYFLVEQRIVRRVLRASSFSHQGVDDEATNVGVAFALAFVAGSFSLVGSIVIFCAKKKLHVDSSGSEKYVAASLAVASGVMLFVALFDILHLSTEHFKTHGYSLGTSTLFATLAFSGGIIVTVLLEKIVHQVLKRQGEIELGETIRMEPFESQSPSPSALHSHESSPNSGTAYGDITSSPTPHQPAKSLPPPPSVSIKRVGVLAAAAIGLHNIPEGFATYVGAIDDASIGVSIAFAIAIHNVPEGFAISVPIYYSSGSKKKALLWSLIAALSEPLGALIAWTALSAQSESVTISDSLFGWLFGIVSGIMTMVVIQELLPAAFTLDGSKSVCPFGIIVGMLVMASSLILFAYTA